MSVFHDIQRRCVAAVDKVMAEDVTLLFMAGDGRSDPERPASAARAVVRTGGDMSSGESSRRSWAAQIAAGKGLAHIDRALYAGPPPRKGDRLRADETPGKPIYAIVSVDDRDPGRLVLTLAEL